MVVVVLVVELEVELVAGALLDVVVVPPPPIQPLATTPKTKTPTKNRTNIPFLIAYHLS
ncbi:hypothetical protein JCM16138_03070 [Thermococcus atlanticus]